MKRIIIAENAGFCMGVERAIRISLREAEKEPLYIYGDLIHNPPTIKKLEENNVFVEYDIEKLKGKNIAIRTHGTTPMEKERLKGIAKKLIDLTCPRVSKVHRIISIYKSKGYSTIIIGEKRHPEVKGHLGYAGDTGRVIEGDLDSEDIDWIRSQDNLIVVAQTTISRGKFQKIVDDIKKIREDVVIYDTICSTTEDRQREVRDMKGIVDYLIVIGGKNSANTRHLYEIAVENGINAIHIETKDELDLDKLREYDTIGITAGASTPKWIVEEIVEYIKNAYDNKDA